jgi:hypothetical protein
VHAPTKVRVRHVRRVVGYDGRPGYDIGLEFVSVPPALRAQIESLLNDAGSATAGV